MERDDADKLMNGSVILNPSNRCYSLAVWMQKIGQLPGSIFPKPMR